MKNLSLLTALVIALFLSSDLQATPSACNALPVNLVKNCGFETGTLSGWTVNPTGFLGQYYGVDTVDANTGTYGAYLAGQSSNVVLSQLLPTVAGTTYYVNFDLAHPDPNFAPYSNSFVVNFGSSAVYSESNQVFGYTRFSFGATASSSSTLLQFGAFDPLNFFSLDDVEVYPAPEPSTLAFTFPILLGGALLVKRRCQVRFELCNKLKSRGVNAEAMLAG